MKTKILPPLILLIGIILLQSCEKEDPKLDPRKAILGKWEITHLGVGNNPRPYPANGYHREYLLDSVVLYYKNDTLTGKEKYWFTDSLLFTSFEFVDDFGETIVFKSPYKYKFITPNKLRLDLQFPAIFTTSNYQHIN